MWGVLSVVQSIQSSRPFLESQCELSLSSHCCPSPICLSWSSGFDALCPYHISSLRSYIFPFRFDAHKSTVCSEGEHRCWSASQIRISCLLYILWYILSGNCNAVENAAQWSLHVMSVMDEHGLTVHKQASTIVYFKCLLAASN